ncbi:hypothetical protein TIFTF001_037065 [Ficus carica]|uniref:Uncharacterized protein n=1 Tax=Ficus carica TaxID=3494 RepID=A0AA88JBH5_FICCA|nr:hypothetical protein TIFTF001_036722 [Ficus carica]GMN67668.1 hypothetical protein TIFTF001_036732 [Ficus carica]GMN67999.1 hypothetical protein TIFTF001_037058 [Ficus carica]GMN68004.1 hypothetical protein TIFTF001_037065 [Ficus carica]
MRSTRQPTNQPHRPNKSIGDLERLAIKVRLLAVRPSKKTNQPHHPDKSIGDLKKLAMAPMAGDQLKPTTLSRKTSTNTTPLNITILSRIY